MKYFVVLLHTLQRVAGICKAVASARERENRLRSYQSDWRIAPANDRLVVHRTCKPVAEPTPV